ncbi:MAG: hypothetical protein QOF78_3634 [Phycisphaerales bacterium]|jgi:hypothetical protein|nr:hypothetical protein [Phycisphaerales bacterium]
MTTTAPIAAAPAQPVEIEKIPDHRDRAREYAADFFAPPPPQIGTVISAESSLKQGKGGLPFIVRLIIALLAAGAVVAACMWAASGMRRQDGESLVIIGYIMAAIAAAIAMFVTRFKARCTYVGERGAIRYTLTRSRNATPKIELLLFDDAAEVHAAQTRQFLNGVYTHTAYDYDWTDAAGKRLLRVKGQHRGNNAPPKPGDAWHFANAAENAWSEHFLARAQQQLKDEGSIAFRIDKRRVVRVGPGFLEFHFGEAPQRVTAEEIASVGLGGGHFSFKHKDAKWYSRSGKYTFSYGAMGNGKVFLFALEKLMGYRWE